MKALIRLWAWTHRARVNFASPGLAVIRIYRGRWNGAFSITYVSPKPTLRGVWRQLNYNLVMKERAIAAAERGEDYPGLYDNEESRQLALGRKNAKQIS
jgi:hypothetical protein